MIAAEDFDAIAVELCETRYQSIANPDQWKKMDLFQIIRQGKAGLVAANLALGSYQKRLADQFGIEPGAEMRAALNAAEQQSKPHLLVDRDIGITLKRVFRSVGFLEKLGIVGGLIASLFSRDEISETDIEQLKQGDMLESTFSEFAEQSASLYQGLIGERDQYMAASLREAAEHGKHKNVFCVLGAGHLKGTCEALRNSEENPAELKEQLNQMPPKKNWIRLIPWLITAIILLGFGIAFSKSAALGLQVIWTWVLINGTLSALGALLAGGHPLTVISGFVAAPLTSLNPTVAAGMVTASVETWLRKPTVGDFESLRTDLIKTSGWWKNRVSRVLLVLIFSNIGSMIGTWVAGLRIFQQIS